jgi:hypothetical protein
MDGMHWMMWGGLVIWLVVLILIVAAAVMLIRFLRTNRTK